MVTLKLLREGNVAVERGRKREGEDKRGRKKGRGRKGGERWR
jgi:hypothetical protein